MIRYIILFLTFPVLVIAQDKKDLSDEQINVVKPYQPTLSDAVKISSTPAADTSEIVPQKLKYSLNPMKYPLKIEASKIKAAKIKDETIPRLYKNYVKVGMGNYNSPFAELYTGSLRSKDFIATAHLKHHSSAGSITGRGNPSFSQNLVELNGKRLYEKETLEGGFNYNREVVHYYGYNPSDSILKPNNIRQQYNLYQVNLGIANTDEQNLSHKISTSYYNLGDRQSAFENTFNLNSDLSYKLSKNKAGIDFGIKYINNKQPMVPGLDRTLLVFVPYYLLQDKIWWLKGGLNISSLISTKGSTHVYPHIEGEYTLAENYLVVFGHLKGNLQPVTMYDLYSENPFINSNQLYDNENVKIDVKGGLRGAISSNTSFTVAANYKDIDNMALFVNDSLSKLHNTFKVVYDHVTMFNLRGELSHHFFEKIRAGIRSDYFSYKTTRQEQAWYKPAFVSSIFSTYNIGNKFLLTLDVFVLSNQYAKTYDASNYKVLAGVGDFNFGLDYRYSKIFSLFAKFNNVGAVRYYRWDGYPTQRFNFMAGLTYSF